MEIGDHIAQVGFALLLIVALVVGLGFLLRRLNQGGLGSSGDIRVVASTFLGPKDKVMLVEVRGRELLLGVNGQAITSLAEFPAPAEAVQPFSKVLDEARA